MRQYDDTYSVPMTFGDYQIGVIRGDDGMASIVGVGTITDFPLDNEAVFVFSKVDEEYIAELVIKALAELDTCDMLIDGSDDELAYFWHWLLGVVVNDTMDEEGVEEYVESLDDFELVDEAENVREILE